MKAFIYNNELYIRCIPGKNLFKSTMVHEVVNRGDIFALRVRDQVLTIVPGTAEVEHRDVITIDSAAQIAKDMKAELPIEAEIDDLRADLVTLAALIFK